MRQAKNIQNPQDRHLKVLRNAMALHQSGKVQDAAQLYCQVLNAVPNQVDALHYLGVAQHQLGNQEVAIDLMQRAIKLVPDYIDAQNNLANILKENGRLNEAEQAYRAVILARPDFALAYNNLGVVLAAQRHFVDAVAAYRQCLELTPDDAQAWHNLGNALKKSDDIEGALSAYKQAILLAPYNGSAHQDLGNALAMQKRFDEALCVFQRWLLLEPDNAVIHHMIAAYKGGTMPSRASDAYVQKTFDSFAESFDEVLGELEYHAPALVGEKLAHLLGIPESSFDILDAGCGTGLCASYLKPYARYLAGVDLSAGMLAKAALRKNYDQLAQAELTAFLAMRPDAFDCIVCADTLCYFGALDGFMKTATDAMRPGAFLVFTVEQTIGTESAEDYFLHPHGRYSHKENYVREVTQAFGLQLLEISHVTLRKESDQPVLGLLVAARK